MTKTQEELDTLKHDWCGDACWDIEDTAGFEDHRAELLQYRLEMEAKWKATQEKEKAERLTFKYNLEKAAKSRANGWSTTSLCYATMAVAIALDALAARQVSEGKPDIEWKWKDIKSIIGLEWKEEED